MDAARVQNTSSTNSTIPHTSISAEYAWTEWIAHINSMILVAVSVSGTSLITLFSVLLMFCFKRLNGWLLTIFYSISVGTMTSVATLGLLNAALVSAAQSRWSSHMPWIPVSIGMVIGLVILQVMTGVVDFLYYKLGASASSMGEYSLQEDAIPFRTLSTDEGGNGTADEADHQLETMILDKKRQAERHLNSPLEIPRRALKEKTEALVMPQKPLNMKQRRIQRAIMLITVTLLQQIPEGFSVGIAIGSISQAPDHMVARNRAVRIALTTTLASWVGALPEVIALLVPLRECGVKRWHIIVTITAGVLLELLAAVASMFLITYVRAVMPFALGGAGAAILFAVMSELVHAAYEHEYRTLAIFCMMTSLTSMMIFIYLFG